MKRTLVNESFCVVCGWSGGKMRAAGAICNQTHTFVCHLNEMPQNNHLRYNRFFFHSRFDPFTLKTSPTHTAHTKHTTQKHTTPDQAPSNQPHTAMSEFEDVEVEGEKWSDALTQSTPPAQPTTDNNTASKPGSNIASWQRI